MLLNILFHTTCFRAERLGTPSWECYPTSHRLLFALSAAGPTEEYNTSMNSWDINKKPKSATTYAYRLKKKKFVWNTEHIKTKMHPHRIQHFMELFNKNVYSTLQLHTVDRLERGHLCNCWESACQFHSNGRFYREDLMLIDMWMKPGRRAYSGSATLQPSTPRIASSFTVSLALC